MREIGMILIISSVLLYKTINLNLINHLPGATNVIKVIPLPNQEGIPNGVASRLLEGSLTAAEQAHMQLINNTNVTLNVQYEQAQDNQFPGSQMQ